MKSRQPSPNWKGLRLYFHYWRQFPLLTGLSLLFSLLLGLQMTVLPLLIAAALGQLIHHNAVSMTLIVFAVGFQFSVASLCYLTDAYGVALLHKRITEHLYRDSFNYLVHQDYSFFANRFSGSIVTQASRFSKVYTTLNDTMFFQLIPQLVGVVVAIGIMSYYSLWIGLITLGFWIVATVIVVVMGLKRLPLRRSAVAKESEQIGELADVIGNALTVKTFAAEAREKQRYDVINTARSLLFLRSWRTAIRNGWIIRGLCSVLQIVVFIGGIYAVTHGNLAISTFLLFQVYILNIINSIDSSSMIVRQLEAVSGDAQEMAELLDQPPEIRDSPDAKSVTLKNGLVTFNSVGFQYADGGKKDALFDNLNLTIKPGEKVGLVGPSGGGKTTITRLLLRFLDITSGSIAIDGHNIQDIRQEDLRRGIAYVPQEPLLFHRSIKENIRYGKPDATDEEIIAVAKKAFAHGFIMELPESYDTLVGERGVKLSGGQRQRIAIARAMLTSAPILVLDEATSALDSESEVLIQKALRELMKQKTAIVIAHRLSTIQRMDRIIVLDNGAVTEQGTHTELIKKKSLYAKLWSHQSGGFLEE